MRPGQSDGMNFNSNKLTLHINLFLTINFLSVSRNVISIAGHLSPTYVWDPSAIPRAGRRLGARPPTGRCAAAGTASSRWADGGGRFGRRRRTLRRRGRTSVAKIKFKKKKGGKDRRVSDLR